MIWRILLAVVGLVLGVVLFILLYLVASGFI